MQRLNELNCLEFVKSVIKKEKINGVCKPIFYFVQDVSLIEKIILRDKLQDTESKFPDFKDDNSLIEHFFVSASELIDDKGSKLKQIESKFNKEVDEDFNEQIKQHSYNPNTITTLSYEMEQPKWNYKFYLSSFKRSFEHHIISLKNYN